MDNAQEKAFWSVISVLDEEKLLPHIMVIGSWAEYIYRDFFSSEFMPSIRTRDLDLFYLNTAMPKEKINIITPLSNMGFIYSADSFTGSAKFFKEDLLEIEFLTRSLGSGRKSEHKIESIGLIADGLKDVNIFFHYQIFVQSNGYNLPVPHPAAYIIQKILINPHRKPSFKREKDISAVKDLILHVEKNDDCMQMLKSIFTDVLSKKEKTIVAKTCAENKIYFCDEIKNYKIIESLER